MNTFSCRFSFVGSIYASPGAAKRDFSTTDFPKPLEQSWNFTFVHSFHLQA